jgi:folate-binding protein YgfZ
MDALNDRAADGSDTTALAWSPLTEYGLIVAQGEDARDFLHAQLTSDIAGLDADHARLAGWCSAKGRLLASFVVVPLGDGFALQLASDLVAPVLKRLSMFVLRAKVKLHDASGEWAQLGVWGSTARMRLAPFVAGLGDVPFSSAHGEGVHVVAIEADRFLVLAAAAQAQTVEHVLGRPAAPHKWRLLEIRAGRPHIVLATQDQFVPQMVNLEALGGVDFKKGCYPGQEVVARTQYRGQLKRRMVRARLAAGTASVAPGQELHWDAQPGQAGGTVVNAAPSPDGDELLAVVLLEALESPAPLRVSSGGAALELLAAPAR